jgi:hypothetical protein
MVKLLALLAALVLGVALMPTGTRADGSWLDQQPLPVWTTAGMAIPSAPTGDFGPPDPQCLAATRPAETAEDQQVAAAGWLLVGSYQGGWGTLIVTGTSSFDGMCRPLDYQVFVFAGGAFAGTISPVAMASREDGSVGRVTLSNIGSTAISATFARYSSSDALCCPSRTTVVDYAIAQTNAGPVLFATDAFTQPNG